MTDTIELLETIGRDASLRHAASNDLAQMLDGLDASINLKLATATGDAAHLMQELAPQDHQVNQNPHDGGCEGTDDDADKDEGDRSGDKKGGEDKKEP